jgi:uncharacterized repeat protein (TIGR01451 family)
MKTRQLFTALCLGLILTAALLVIIGQAAPGNPQLSPPRNSHTAPMTTTISITYDERIDASTVNSRTFAVHAMQSGLVTATHGVNGSTIAVTPTRPLHQGELVYVVATTRTLSITGTEPLSATQWQFRAGEVTTRCVAGFSDISAGLPSVYRSSVEWGDYDKDGDLDILLIGYDSSDNSISKVYRNDGESVFNDISAGLTGVAWGSTAWGDYDNDGDLDILFTGFDDLDNPVAKVYRNDGEDVFSDISADLTGVAHSSVAWGDYDNDGDLDILLTGGYYSSGWNRFTRMYRNNGADTFSLITITPSLPDISHSSVKWGDYDNDGDLDILLTGYELFSGRMAKVYQNDGGDKFADINAGITGVDYSSADWGDYDNDGDLDILLTGYDGSNAISQVYRNDGVGKFTDIFAGLIDVYVGTAAWGDYDNDGDLDILLAGSTNGWPTWITRVYRNDGEDTFTDIYAGLPGLPGSAAWGDYDNDGDLDILLADGGSTSHFARVYRNEDCLPELILTKFATPAIAAPGQTITYTLDFSNNGILTATKVFITDRIPISVTTTSIVSNGTIITNIGTPPTYVWRVQDMAPGESGTIIINGVLSNSLATGSFTNTASIVCVETENDTNNNSGSARVAVDADPPDGPILVTPGDGTVTSTAALTLAWLPTPGTDATGYLLDFNGTVIDVGNTFFFPAGFLVDGNYTWTVAAYDALHNTSSYNDAWSFIIDTTSPGMPTLLSPGNGAVINDTTPTLAWQASLDAAGYLLDWNGKVLDVGNITQYIITIQADGIYTWSVAAYDVLKNTSPYNDIWSFTVKTGYFIYLPLVLSNR